MCNTPSVLRFAVLVLSVALTFSFAAAPAGFAQVVSTNGGSIEGLITDSSGAIVPGAAVVIADRDSGFSKSVVTDKAGLYSVGPLAPRQLFRNRHGSRLFYTQSRYGGSYRNRNQWQL